MHTWKLSVKNGLLTFWFEVDLGPTQALDGFKWTATCDHFLKHDSQTVDVSLFGSIQSGIAAAQNFRRSPEIRSWNMFIALYRSDSTNDGYSVNYTDSLLTENS